MRADEFLSCLPCDFFCGVPDSQLSALCDTLIRTYGVGEQHIIAANEGNAVAIAAGHYLATGNLPLVYLQNSGVGNIINPVTSLLSDQVYGIPCLFVVGHRGEIGMPDEPQHAFMGQATAELLNAAGVPTFDISADTNTGQVLRAMEAFAPHLAAGGSVAFLVKKGALTENGKGRYRNPFSMTREEAICHIADAAGDSPIICTTGKASRELFEIREETGMSHERDFLTVGSMGHCSSIALGIALQKPGVTVYCIDGDGAILMHMGAMAVIGDAAPNNLIHICINNCAHESVGGMPTVAGGIDLVGVAAACGYGFCCRIETPQALTQALTDAKTAQKPAFIEVRCAIGARSDLGRPTRSPKQNMAAFMAHLKKES